MTVSHDVVILGDCNPDVLVVGGDVTPAFGQEEKLVGSVSLVIGGSAAITAVAAARLGLSVALVAVVGADPAGDFMLSQLAREGVDTAAITVREDQPTGMTVALSRGADRAILTALGTIGSLAAPDVPVALLTAARHVHVSSYFLVERTLGPGLAGLFAAARAAGAVTSLDTNWDPAGGWGGAQLREVLAETSLLLPNEGEALRISGGADLGTAAGVLTGWGPDLVVKLGARGALCAQGSRWELAELAPVTPVDATGAGDCFNAGLIAGLAEGLPLAEAARLGCAAGALSTRAAGGTAAAPTLDEARVLAQTVTLRPTSP
ncbi:MAG TPA: PfkB family carbohydrate kinase [Streptosporangiaceae bacterium]|nr:PfkB family carbohydrate kinase [Streptosporangiaceae bacterium]